MLDAERAARAEAEAALSEMTVGSAASDQEKMLKAEIDRLTRALDAQGLDNQRLRDAQAGLREELRRLREAVVGDVADAGAINRSLQAELDSLRAARAAETTEMADILSALDGIVAAEEVRAHA